VQVLCSEGIANYSDPESCVLHREMHGEAFDRGANRPAKIGENGVR
jgi:hypothetical protein